MPDPSPVVAWQFVPVNFSVPLGSSDSLAQGSLSVERYLSSACPGSLKRGGDRSSNNVTELAPLSNRYNSCYSALNSARPEMQVFATGVGQALAPNSRALPAMGSPSHFQLLPTTEMPPVSQLPSPSIAMSRPGLEYNHHTPENVFIVEDNHSPGPDTSMANSSHKMAGHRTANKRQQKRRDNQNTPRRNRSSYSVTKSPKITSPKAYEQDSRISKTKKSTANPRNLKAQEHQIVCIQDEGKIKGFRSIIGASQKFRGAQTAEERKSTQRAREIGSCVKCRVGKQRCDRPAKDFVPCGRCMSFKSIEIMDLECQDRRRGLVELILFRRGPAENSGNHPLRFNMSVLKRRYRSPDASPSVSLPSNSVKYIEISQGLDCTLSIPVELFQPCEGDKIAYEWRDKEQNQKRIMEMPLWGISMSKHHFLFALKSLVRYTVNNQLRYIFQFLDMSNLLVRYTLEMAIKLQDESSLIRLALQILATSRFIERSWQIKGSEALGIAKIEDGSNPWNGTVPVTPMIDQQLDRMVIYGILIYLRKNFVAELDRLVYDRDTVKQNSFEIFIAIFISLNSCETFTKHSYKFARKYGLDGRYGPKGTYLNQERIFDTAIKLLAHWHHIVCQGTVPISIEEENIDYWDGQHSSPDRREYVRSMKQEILRQQPYFKILLEKNQLEQPLYWCHQLFSGKWEAKPPHIEEYIDIDIEAA